MVEDVVTPHSPKISRGTAAGHAHLEGGQRARTWQLSLASLAIVTVLGFQLAADILRTDFMWPFLDYPMYSYSRHEGQRLVVFYDVYGTTSDGDEVKVAPEDLGMDWWLFRRRFLADVFTDSLKDVAVYLDDYRTRHGKEIIALRVEDRAIIVTRDKIDLSPAPKVVKEIVIERPGA